jgi:hypothetical protein
VPCPLLPATASSKNQTTSSFFFFASRKHQANSSPPQNQRTAIPYHLPVLRHEGRSLISSLAVLHRLRSFTRATCLARVSAPFNPINASCCSARYRFAQFHPRNTPLRAATAARNRTPYRWPPAGAVAFDSATTSGRGFIPSVKGSDAAPYLLRSLIRATCFARATAPGRRD